MVDKLPIEKRLAQTVWQRRQITEKPDIKPDGKNWLMDTMPFNAVCKETLQADYPLQYLCEGKYISFKPVGALASKGVLNKDNRSVSYKDALGSGISIDVHTSQSHWRKLITIASLGSLGSINQLEFVEFSFEVETDFDIPDEEIKKPRIRLGENSYIERAQARDSTPEVFDPDTGDISINRIPVKSFFERKDNKLYFIKQIPTEWLKTAVFPVWTDVDIVWGAAQEFGVANSEVKYPRCCEIDTNKFAVAWTDVDDDGGKARVGTVVGTVITWGAINTFDADIVTGTDSTCDICKLDTDKFVVVYQDAGDSKGDARVGVVTVRTIAWGAVKNISDGEDSQRHRCCQLGTDKFAICDNEWLAGLGSVSVCTVVANVITAGAPVTFEGNFLQGDICKLDTDKFVVVYRDDADNRLKACGFAVAALVPTAGVIKEISVNQPFNCCAEQLDTDKFVMAWYDGTTTEGYIEICTVGAAPNCTITEGAQTTLEAGGAHYPGLARVDGSHFVVTYMDMNNADKGTSRYCSFSGTTIILGDEEVFNDAATAFTQACLISNGYVVAVYRDSGDVNLIGEAVVGDMGWTGEIAGVINPAMVAGVDKANIASVKGVA